MTKTLAVSPTVDTVTKTRRTVTHTPTVDILSALDKAFVAIRKHNPNVPGAIAIAIGTGRGKVKGHFAPGSWEDSQGEHAGSARHEILIATEHLARGSEAVLTTLIHEAAHAESHASGVKDTSRQGRYHNQRFAQTATRMGLTIESNDSIGFITTGLDTGAKVTYSRELAALDVALSTFRKPIKAKEKSAKTTIKVSCECITEKGTPLSVTVPISWYDAQTLVCESCESHLLPV